MGTPSQESVYRVIQYYGFKFTDPSKVNLNVWKESKEHGFFIPNIRSKKGREMMDFLRIGLETSYFEEVFMILKIKRRTTFGLPFVKITNSEILIILSPKEPIPTDENVISVNKGEFESFFPPKRPLKK